MNKRLKRRIVVVVGSGFSASLTSNGAPPIGNQTMPTLANLADANLQGADLSGADLRGATFEYAELQSARFCNCAELMGKIGWEHSPNGKIADLRGAHLEGAHNVGHIPPSAVDKTTTGVLRE
jgi:uncharacterized protein YjbI with pentapeptide repeats